MTNARMAGQVAEDVRAPPVKLAMSRPILERGREKEREIDREWPGLGLIIHESSVALDKLFLAVRFPTGGLLG